MLIFEFIQESVYISYINIFNMTSTRTIITWDDLSLELQQKAKDLRLELYKSKQRNTSSELLLYNEAGTFFLYAKRRSMVGSQGYHGHIGWLLHIGRVKTKIVQDPYTYEVTDVELYNSTLTRFTKTADGTEIPKMMKTKKELVEFIRKHFPKSFKV